jgi:hypothetical protein
MEESDTDTSEANLSGVISCKATMALATSTVQIEFRTAIIKKKYLEKENLLEKIDQRRSCLCSAFWI